MRMNNKSLGETAAGKVINIMSNDLQRFEVTFMLFHYIWIIPIQVIIISWLGYTTSGYVILIGLLAMALIALPIQGIYYNESNALSPIYFFIIFLVTLMVHRSILVFLFHSSKIYK